MFNQLTTGAGNDFEKCHRTWRARWSASWGMSEKLGPLTFGKQ